MNERSTRLTWLILAVIALLAAVAACGGGGEWLWHQLLALHGMAAPPRH